MTDDSKPKDDAEERPFTPEEIEKYTALLQRCEEVDQMATVLSAALLFYTQDHPHTQLTDTMAAVMTFAMNHCKAILHHFKGDADPFARCQVTILRMLQAVTEQIAAEQIAGQEGVTH